MKYKFGRSSWHSIRTKFMKLPEIPHVRVFFWVITCQRFFVLYFTCICAQLSKWGQNIIPLAIMINKLFRMKLTVLHQILCYSIRLCFVPWNLFRLKIIFRGENLCAPILISMNLYHLINYIIFLNCFKINYIFKINIKII